jgi:outer membrane receptor for ferrienterochelin and colicin
VNDDWRVRPNLTFSYGLRYEAQTNIGDHGDFAPRLAVAWGVDGGANKAAKTVLRAGFGVFYDRIGINDSLNAMRYNGLTQQSYLILNPDFFPTDTFARLAGRQPAAAAVTVALRRHSSAAELSVSVGVDRQ